MRLYAAVAFLTFAGSFAVYSAMHMSGAANAIGAGRPGSAMSTADLFHNFNPLTLLRRDRLQALASSGEGAIRTEPFRAKFNASAPLRARQPKFDPALGRKARSGPPTHDFRPPAIRTPAYRAYR
jgi:hypothetical protein